MGTGADFSLGTTCVRSRSRTKMRVCVAILPSSYASIASRCAVEHGVFALVAFAIDGHVVDAQHDVLRRRDDRRAVGGGEDVVRREHQDVRFGLGFDAQRKVDGHLVAVEVGVEAFADQRVNLDGVAFNQHRLESLDAHAVKRRSAIQHHRVLVDALLRECPRPRGRGARASSWRT